MAISCNDCVYCDPYQHFCLLLKRKVAEDDPECAHFKLTGSKSDKNTEEIHVYR